MKLSTKSRVRKIVAFFGCSAMFVKLICSQHPDSFQWPELTRALGQIISSPEGYKTYFYQK